MLAYKCNRFLSLLYLRKNWTELLCSPLYVYTLKNLYSEKHFYKQLVKNNFSLICPSFLYSTVYRGHGVDYIEGV